MDIDCELKYKSEHIKCIYYATNNTRKISVIEIQDKEIYIKKNCESTTLYFVMEGIVKVGIKKDIKQKIESGNFFLSETGFSPYIQAIGSVLIITCDISDTTSLCNEYSLRHLVEYYKENYKRIVHPKNEIFTLPIIPLLREELYTIKRIHESGVNCLHMQKMKIEIILLMLRAFYTRDNLALLFAPLLTEEFEFKLQILTSYNKKFNVQEMIDCTGLSQSTFTRKFMKVFGITPKQFLTQRKRSALLRDIVTSRLSIKQLAEEYGMTQNYITKFTHQTFGMTPTELRYRHHKPLILTKNNQSQISPDNIIISNDI